MSKRRREGYEYIWCPKVDISNVIFLIKENASPYLEINSDFINEDFQGENNIIEVNPYIRFNHIFSDFLYTFKNIEEKKGYSDLINKKFKNNLEHNALAYLRELDFVTGTTVADIYCEYILKDIEKGKFGRNILKYFRRMSEEDRKIAVLLIYNNISTKIENRKSFELGIKYFFTDSIIYMDKFEDKKIIVYINYKKDKINTAKIRVLESLFLPFGTTLKCYWGHHFGVIGVNDTMKIGEVSVF